MLADINTWVLDLDNTLYPPSVGLADQMNVRIRAYLANLFGADEAEALRMQSELVAEHGTTLRGLMNTRGIDPHDYLSWEHTIDYSVLRAGSVLAAAIRELPGRKYVFTNGSAYHANEVLSRLGLSALFDGVFDILAGGLIPKPYPDSYHRFVDQFGITPERTVFSDDLDVNLSVPYELGMTTAWMTHEPSADGTPYQQLGPKRWQVQDLPAFLGYLVSGGS
ncbi:pyrimidine 5'-nucleotidase [Kribbella sp. NPDC051586]|uniref:pyrimidine 5'-nucleotidase n=1 Tax=Kribbella sp. NPDC051586 TaxID=3364118 RepID=UPI0037982995